MRWRGFDRAFVLSATNASSGYGGNTGACLSTPQRRRGRCASAEPPRTTCGRSTLSRALNATVRCMPSYHCECTIPRIAVAVSVGAPMDRRLLRGGRGLMPSIGAVQWACMRGESVYHPTPGALWMLWHCRHIIFSHCRPGSLIASSSLLDVRQRLTSIGAHAFCARSLRLDRGLSVGSSTSALQRTLLFSASARAQPCHRWLIVLPCRCSVSGSPITEAATVSQRRKQHPSTAIGNSLPLSSRNVQGRVHFPIHAHSFLRPLH
jgi:hypothetical protein